jgi:ubiquinone/menaquinone biosynthesis C-methylase UbiE
VKIYEKFWDRIARRYSRAPVADEAAYQEKLRKTREYLTPDTEVFEFGCGTGSTAVYHAPYVKRILAIDVSSKMIEIARAKAESKGIDNVSFEVGSIEDFEAAEESYDVVMAHSILHLLKDRSRALAKVHSMLKPGGTFVSSTGCVQNVFLRKAIGLAFSLVSLTGFMPYINISSAEQLVRSIEEAGFHIEHQWRPDRNAALFLIAKKI